MRQRTKKELEERNVALSRQNEALLCLVIDIMRGEAAVRTEGDVTWLISRPGAASSGCAVTYASWDAGDPADAIEAGYIEDLARQVNSARHASYYSALSEDAQRRIADSYTCGVEAAQISRIGMGEGCAPKLPSVLGGFHRVKLG